MPLRSKPTTGGRVEAVTVADVTAAAVLTNGFTNMLSLADAGGQGAVNSERWRMVKKRAEGVYFSDPQATSSLAGEAARIDGAGRLGRVFG